MGVARYTVYEWVRHSFQLPKSPKKKVTKTPKKQIEWDQTRIQNWDLNNHRTFEVSNSYITATVDGHRKKKRKRKENKGTAPAREARHRLNKKKTKLN